MDGVTKNRVLLPSLFSTVDIWATQNKEWRRTHSKTTEKETIKTRAKLLTIHHCTCNISTEKNTLEYHFLGSLLPEPVFKDTPKGHAQAIFQKQT